MGSSAIRRGLLAALVLCSASPGLAGEGEVPPDALPIQPAVVAHLSAEGLNALGEAIEGVVPTGITVSGLSGELDCDEAEEGTLTYSSDPIELHLAADSVTITPVDGSLDIEMAMTLWSDDAALTVNGPCVIELDEACVLGLPPTELLVQVGIDLVLENGQLAAQVDHLWFTHGNFGNPIETGCVLGDALETMQSYGVDLLGEILDTALESQIEELRTQLEEALAGLTSSLALSDSLALGEATVDYELEATELALSSTGLQLGFSATFDAASYGSCVPQDSGPYLGSAHDPPALTGVLPETVTPYHFGVLVNEDLANQALYALWQAGGLCLRLADLVDFNLTTDYLALLDEELITSIWPQPVTLDAVISPMDPPRVLFADGPTFDAELTLDIYGQELDRQARLWSNRLLANGGVGVELSEGALDLVLDFDLESHLGITVAYNEWLPSAVPEGFAGLIPDLASNFVDLEDLAPAFPLPALYGITLSALEMRTVGEEQDYLGVFAWIDPDQAQALEIGPIDLGGVGCGDTGGGGEIAIPGCEEGLGCEDETGCSGDGGAGCGDCAGEEGGCGESSCTHGVGRVRIPIWAAFWLIVPPLIASRRRR